MTQTFPPQRPVPPAPPGAGCGLPCLAGSVLGACLLAGAAAFVLVVCAGLWFSGGSSTSGPRGPITTSTPVRNPLDEQLAGPPGAATAPRREGVAVAVLVDVSGSMAEPVRDADGRNRAKIEIARRCVVELARQSERFAQEHPDRKVVVAIYEFSARDRQPSCRQVRPLGPPNASDTQRAVAAMRPDGGTPIGDAMIHAKRDLDAAGYSRQHILVVTDGDNNRGYTPGDVAAANQRLPEDRRAAVYLIAFDTAAAKFAPVRNAGGTVLGASNEAELRQQFDYVLGSKILVEELPPTKPR